MDFLPCLRPSKGRHHYLNIYAHGHRFLGDINRKIRRVGIDNDRYFCGYNNRLYRF